jgi:alpha-glucuronidase
MLIESNWTVTPIALANLYRFASVLWREQWTAHRIAHNASRRREFTRTGLTRLTRKYRVALGLKIIAA